MPVPKRKRSRARRDSRFANKGLQVQAVAFCQNCQTPRIAHSACQECGYYKGVKVLATKAERSVKRTAIKAAKKAKQPTDQEQNTNS